MLAALLITFREGLEAALIVGIVLGVLRCLGRSGRSISVWSGVIVATLVSALAALALHAVGVALEGRGEQIFEGVTMLLACGVLTWMILWMQRQGRRTQTDLEQSARRALSADNGRMLFGLSFIAVLREGIETALFLTAAAFSATTVETLIGGALGLLTAVAVGWLVYVAGKRLNLRAFFRATGLLLILFAAGLFAQGIHELQEAALLPVVIEHVWNINPILSEEGTLGSLLKALFGYNSSPSLLEIIGYVAYLIVASLAWRSAERVRPVSPAARNADPNEAQQAIEGLEQDLKAAREIGDRLGEGKALGALGKAYHRRGEVRRAIDYYEQALAIYREIGNRHGKGNVLDNLGLAYTDLGEVQRAIECYEQHLKIAQEIGDPQGEALTAWNLGLVYEQLGEPARAARWMQIRVDYERAIGHPDAEHYARQLEEVRRKAGQARGT